MSTHTEVTIHCDGCGEWVHSTDSSGNSTLGWRRAMGWTCEMWPARWDWCPACSAARAEAAAG